MKENELKVYNMQEICKLLDISYPTARNLIRDGKLIALDTEGVLRVSHIQLVKYLEGK